MRQTSLPQIACIRYPKWQIILWMLDKIWVWFWFRPLEHGITTLLFKSYTDKGRQTAGMANGSLVTMGQSLLGGLRWVRVLTFQVPFYPAAYDRFAHWYKPIENIDNLRFLYSSYNKKDKMNKYQIRPMMDANGRLSYYPFSLVMDPNALIGGHFYIINEMYLTPRGWPNGTVAPSFRVRGLGIDHPRFPHLRNWR